MIFNLILAITYPYIDLNSPISTMSLSSNDLLSATDTEDTVSQVYKVVGNVLGLMELSFNRRKTEIACFDLQSEDSINQAFE